MRSDAERVEHDLRRRFLDAIRTVSNLAQAHRRPGNAGGYLDPDIGELPARALRGRRGDTCEWREWALRAPRRGLPPWCFRGKADFHLRVRTARSPVTKY